MLLTVSCLAGGFSLFFRIHIQRMVQICNERNTHLWPFSLSQLFRFLSFAAEIQILSFRLFCFCFFFGHTVELNTATDHCHSF